MAYDASNIKVLEGLEAVRVRPAMYIGSTTQKGLNHLVYEIVDNAVDEASNGYGTNIYVRLNSDGSVTVIDEGRGIPVDMHESGVSALRVVLTTLHAGGKFDNNSYKSSAGLHGVGISVVNALSSLFYVDVMRNGKVYEDVYECGQPVTQLVKGMVPVVRECGRKTGTCVTFIPDASIFPNTEFNLSDIQQRLHQTAYLNPNLTIYLYDNRNEEHEEFVYHEPNGIKAYVDELSQGVDELCECYTFNASQESEKGTVNVHVAFKYVESLKETVIGFCNNIQTHEGGTHLTGFKSSLTSLINSYARQLGSLKASDDNFTGADVRSGLIAVVSIQHPDPQFEGQTKTKLDNPEVAKIVSSVCTEQLTLYFDRNVDVLKKVIAVALRCRKLRKAEASAHKNFFAKRKKYSFDSNGKLAGCESKDASTCELFIVEGDSAAGSGKMARDRKHQAILPIRGKILNVEKCTVNKALANEEIKTIIYALGCGFGEGYVNDFDISKLKYDKIIIMTDADSDGRHITTLLMTLFYRLLPEIVRQGHLYCAVPPLYKAFPVKGNAAYMYTDSELKAYLSEHKVSHVQRYKGLGEMNPDQLWETTMNPKTRMLRRVVIDDDASDSRITEQLMGTDVKYRKEFIRDNAQTADIDV